jgi:hypothetical protein
MYKDAAFEERMTKRVEVIFEALVLLVEGTKRFEIVRTHEFTDDPPDDRVIKSTRTVYRMIDNS